MEQQSFLAVANRGVSPKPIQPTDFIRESEEDPTNRIRVGGYQSDQYDSVGRVDLHASRLHEVFLIGMIVCSLLTMVSLFQVNVSEAHGWAFFLKGVFGGLSYLMPVYLSYIGIISYKYLKSRLQSGETLLFRLLGASTLYLSIDSMLGYGKLGKTITESFFNTQYTVEAWIIVLGLFFTGLLLMTNWSCLEVASSIIAAFSKCIFRKKVGFYPIDNHYENNNHIHHYDDSREHNLITYQQPFSNPHIHDPQSNQLVSCLLHFGIKAVVSAKIPGPVITRFELHLAPGTKSSTICSHHKEIARSLCVKEVRVIEVIAGKSCIGIEIPNANREIFSFSDLEDELEISQGKLPLVLGRTTTGECKIVDLDTIPHLLIAGSTRSGKTMLLQSILMSLTQRHTSTILNIMLIDPKKIAFTAWKNLPHLLCPVITESEEAVNALNWCVSEMEKRYESIANNKNEKFPILIVVVDEFSDLVMSHKAQVEEAVKRIAQKARQCGIHLILSTQRPTADVITGHIKTNMPTRIALSVPERRDSRIILDEQGAENLLGQGDMLLKMHGQPCERLHAPFVSDAEVREHVSRLVTNSRSLPEEKGMVSNVARIDFSRKKQSTHDVFYEQVISYIRETKKASTTALQNRFKIGYQKAAGIIDRLEADGIIGKRTKVNAPS